VNSLIDRGNGSKEKLNSKTKVNEVPALARAYAKILRWCELIKLEHTIFALPFALVGLISAGKTLPSLPTVLAVIVAFTSARAAAMSLNRLIDAKIDGKNIRTKDRFIPQGVISKKAALLFAISAFVLMLLAACFLPVICLQLSPIAIIWLSFYSFTKRFTWLCHFVLGIALGGAALAGWIAAGGSLLCQAPWVLSMAVATWVAGFDIIYACQDVEFDQSECLHSLPANFGLRNALIVSSLLHVITVALLFYFGLLLGLGMFFWSGLFLIAAMLTWEHSLVKPNDLSKLSAAFFNINGTVSILAFLSLLCDKVFR
jgi:4-hydroxybenzoate polyprenyltransferase